MSIFSGTASLRCIIELIRKLNLKKPWLKKVKRIFDSHFVRRHAEILCVFLVGSLVLLFFVKTIACGLPVSRLFMLADRDLLFSQFHQNGAFARVDQSVYLLTAPNVFTIAHYWRDLVVPLWSPYVGLGVPLIGDQQSCIFSPWRMLASLSPTVGYYNFQLFLQLVFGAIGGFLLGRLMGLGRLASILLALGFELSPFSLRYLELMGGPVYTAYPWLLLSFLWAAKHTTPLRVCVAGAAVALAVFSGHALIALTGTMACSLCFLLFSVFVYGDNQAIPGRFSKAFLSLCAIGIFTLLFAAPVILPFLECLQNSFCYKFETEQHWASPLAIPYFLMHAGSGDWSSFLGCLTVPLIVCGFFSTGQDRSKFLSIFAVAFFMSFFVCGFGPLAPLINLTPIRFISGTYFAFAVLFFCGIAAAFGVDQIAKTGFGERKQTTNILIAVVITLVVPLLMHVAKVDMLTVTFDEQLPLTDWRVKYWILDAVISVLFVGLLFACRERKISLHYAAFLAVCLVMGSELSVSRTALLPTPRFDFVQTPVHEYLRSRDGRASPMGFNVLVANVNSVYGLRSLALHNPVMLRRYVNFLKNAGGHVDHFNALLEYAPLQPMLDLCSLKYVVSLGSVFSVFDLPKDTKVQSKQVLKFAEDLEIRACELGYSPENREIVGHVNWHCLDKQHGRFSYIAVFSKLNGDLISYGITRPCFPPGKLARACKYNFDAQVPALVAPGESFCLGVRVFDSQTSTFLKCDKAGKDGVVTLGVWKAQKSSNNPTNNQYRLVSETTPQNIRIYENQRAFPEAYLVHKIKTVSSSAKSLELIIGNREYLNSAAIVEMDAKTGSPVLPRPDGEDRALFNFNFDKTPAQQTIELLDALKNAEDPDSDQMQAQAITRPDQNTVRIECSSDKPSFLVVTDQFYPGWTASVDGVATPVYATNYAFRGVPLSAGKHVVVMNFRPMSFIIGSCMALMAVLLMLGFCFYSFVRKKRS